MNASRFPFLFRILDNRRSPWTLAAAAFIVFAAIGFGYLDALMRENDAVSELALDSKAAGQVQALQDILLKAQAPLASLAENVAFSKGDFKNFEEYAAFLLKNYPEIDGLFLAPDGVVGKAVPLRGNEAAMGHELLKDPDRMAEAREAMRTGQTVLAGPVNMRQGGVGLFARKPVFWIEDGGHRFWGLVVALIKWDSIRLPLESSMAASGCAYTLMRQLATDKAPVLISRSAADVGPRNVTRSIPVPGGSWLLTVSDLTPDSRLRHIAGNVIVLVTASVGALLVHLLAKGRLTLLARTSELEALNEELNRRVAEREVLIREVHHRVKNNLQVIISLLDLQAGCVESQAFRELVGACTARVKAISLAHEQLYKGGDLGNIDIREYLEGVLESVLRGHLGPARHIRRRVEAARATISLAKAVPLGLIVTELATNAIKHALGGSGEPLIVISFVTGPGPVATLTVRDNGPGFPEGACPKDTATLGLVLVESLVSQLGGEFFCRNDSGAVAEARFPFGEGAPEQPPSAGLSGQAVQAELQPGG